MEKTNNVYVENLALTARNLLIESGIPLQTTQYYYPEVLNDIVVFFGGKLEIVDSEDCENEHGIDFIEKINESDAFFLIHLCENSTRPVFIRTLHELGHAFLDFPNMEVGEKCFYDGNKASDIQADLFVRAFIMPSTEFENVIKQYIEDGGFNVQQIADHYKIDYVDALIRGKELNYWE